jgi:hypothetical protein
MPALPPGLVSFAEGSGRPDGAYLESEERVVLNEVVLDRGISPYLTNLETYCDGNFVTHVQASGGRGLFGLVWGGGGGPEQERPSGAPASPGAPCVWEAAALCWGHPAPSQSTDPPRGLPRGGLTPKRPPSPFPPSG